jgi:hypothetical protein
MFGPRPEKEIHPIRRRRIRLQTALSYWPERVPKRVPNEQSLQITNYQTLAITRFFEASKGVWIGS